MGYTIEMKTHRTSNFGLVPFCEHNIKGMCKTLITAMPKDVKAMMAIKGGPTKYVLVFTMYHCTSALK